MKIRHLSCFFMLLPVLGFAALPNSSLVAFRGGGEERRGGGEERRGGGEERRGGEGYRGGGDRNMDRNFEGRGREGNEWKGGEHSMDYRRDEGGRGMYGQGMYGHGDEQHWNSYRRGPEGAQINAYQASPVYVNPQGQYSQYQQSQYSQYPENQYGGSILQDLQQ